MSLRNSNSRRKAIPEPSIAECIRTGFRKAGVAATTPSQCVEHDLLLPSTSPHGRPVDELLFHESISGVPQMNSKLWKKCNSHLAHPLDSSLSVSSHSNADPCWPTSSAESGTPRPLSPSPHWLDLPPWISAFGMGSFGNSPRIRSLHRRLDSTAARSICCGHEACMADARGHIAVLPVTVVVFGIQRIQHHLRGFKSKVLLVRSVDRSINLHPRRTKPRDLKSLPLVKKRQLRKVCFAALALVSVLSRGMLFSHPGSFKFHESGQVRSRIFQSKCTKIILKAGQPVLGAKPQKEVLHELGICRMAQAAAVAELLRGLTCAVQMERMATRLRGYM